MIHEHEHRIKEQRTALAIKNNLMGFDGKIGCVVRNLGQKITEHSAGFSTHYNSTSLYDYNSSLEEDDGDYVIPVMDAGVEEPTGGAWRDERQEVESHNIEDIGWFFDGLNRGMHLSIKYLESDKELSVNYKGIIVYREVAGDLEGYVPSPVWEDLIDNLYKVARKKQKNVLQDNKEVHKQEVQKQKTSWLNRIREKWGF